MNTLKKLLKFLRVSLLGLLILPFGLKYGGILSNQACLWANHGYMPVYVNEFYQRQSGWYEGSSDGLHTILTKESHLIFLSDIWRKGNIYESIGDILMDTGDEIWPFCFAIWGGLLVVKVYRNEQQE
jgi:hypothetical protein